MESSPKTGNSRTPCILSSRALLGPLTLQTTAPPPSDSIQETTLLKFVLSFFFFSLTHMCMCPSTVYFLVCLFLNFVEIVSYHMYSFQMCFLIQYIFKIRSFSLYIFTACVIFLWVNVSIFLSGDICVIPSVDIYN